MYMTYMCINLKIHYLPRVSSGLENYTNNEPFSTFIYLLQLHLLIDFSPFVLLQVDGNDKFERVSGTSVGGGTFWGLGKLLTKCKRLS